MTLSQDRDIGKPIRIDARGFGLYTSRNEMNGILRVYIVDADITRFGYWNWAEPALYTNTSRVAIT